MEQESQNGFFLLFIAPLAAGKTSFIVQSVQESRGRWIFFAPLKALALEVHQRVSLHYPAYLYKKGKEGEDLLKTLSQKRAFFLIITEHHWDQKFQYFLFSAMALPISSTATATSTSTNPYYSPLHFVWDEFHLTLHWGESFRQKLWEILYDVAHAGLNVIALTATANEQLYSFCKNLAPLGFSEVAVMDVGNYLWRFSPQFIYPFKAEHQKLFHQFFVRDCWQNKNSSHPHTLLYFCASRSEVDQLARFFRRQNFITLSCKGGEVDIFQTELNELVTTSQIPHMIFSTSCLSHGVNLPPIAAVFISYQETNKDLLYQMIGRGGRQGGAYKAVLINSVQGANILFPNHPGIIPTGTFFFRARIKILYAVSLLASLSSRLYKGISS